MPCAHTLCPLQARVCFAMGRLTSARRMMTECLFFSGETRSVEWAHYFAGSVLLGPCPRRILTQYLPTGIVFR